LLGCVLSIGKATLLSYVNACKNLFHCHGCERGGDLIRFVELFLDLPFRQSIAHLRQETGARFLFRLVGASGCLPSTATAARPPLSHVDPPAHFLDVTREPLPGFVAACTGAVADLLAADFFTGALFFAGFPGGSFLLLRLGRSYRTPPLLSGGNECLSAGRRKQACMLEPLDPIGSGGELDDQMLDDEMWTSPLASVPNTCASCHGVCDRRRPRSHATLKQP
jgi:hypothetical protein